MGREPDQNGNEDLLAFAAQARDRIAPIDKELAQWTQQALLAADPYPATRKAAIDPALRDATPIAVGKAAVPMALAWQHATGRTGLAVVPEGSGAPAGLSDWRIIEAEHPISGPGSHQAGRAALESAANGDDIVLLLSGGASAMLEAPVVQEHEYTRLTKELQRLGLPIDTWNAARALLSRIKAGGLAAASEQAGGTLHTLYVSDVPGDDPRVIGSAPGIHVPIQTLVERIESLPRDLRLRLQEAGGRRPSASHAPPPRCLLSRRAPAERAALAVKASGYRATILDPIDHPVEQVADDLAKALADASKDEVLVVWGEPLVTPPEDAGPGGRTTQLLCTMWARPDAHHALAALMTTDGLDGASGFGGCYARLAPCEAEQGKDARDTWQTASFLAGLPPTTGGGVPARSTGANCADIGILRPPQ